MRKAKIKKKRRTAPKAQAQLRPGAPVPIEAVGSCGVGSPAEVEPELDIYTRSHKGVVFST